MSQPPYDPQWGQQPEPGGYGPPYGDPYAQPYAPGGYGPPPAGGGSNRKLLIILTVAIVVVAAGLVVALVATSGSDSPKAATTNSASGASGTVPTGSTGGSGRTGPTGTGTSPGTSSGSTPVTSSTCHVPAGSTSAPTLAAPELLAAALADKPSFANAPVRFIDHSGTTTLNSLCFDTVSQEDLGLVLAFLDGAGYTKVDGKTDHQKLFQAKDTQQPKFIAITVTGTLVLDRNNFDSNTGAAEIDWQS